MIEDVAVFWDLVEQRAAATPDAMLAVDEQERRLTFAAYRDAALRAAAGLHELGVNPDTAVSWLLPTWLEALVLVAALARLEAVQNPMLPIYRKREVRFIARQTQARLLIVPSTWRGFGYEGAGMGLFGPRTERQMISFRSKSSAASSFLKFILRDFLLPQAFASFLS